MKSSLVLKLAWKHDWSHVNELRLDLSVLTLVNARADAQTSNITTSFSSSFPFFLLFLLVFSVPFFFLPSLQPGQEDVPLPEPCIQFLDSGGQTNYPSPSELAWS